VFECGILPNKSPVKAAVADDIVPESLYNAVHE
jgi:hypothetical protein